MEQRRILKIYHKQYFKKDGYNVYKRNNQRNQETSREETEEVE